jgi:hypothetical protein
MARDFDPYDLSGMTDDEIYDVVVQHLGEYPELDMGWIDVSVKGGRVTLSGRVSSDGEVQIAEKALVEVMGVAELNNELMVDELHRGEAPMAADEASAQDAEVDDPLGEPSQQNHSDTAAHLMEDPESQAFGTRDVSTAIEEGTSYNPPDRPIPDGYGSREDH